MSDDLMNMIECYARAYTDMTRGYPKAKTEMMMLHDEIAARLANMSGEPLTFDVLDVELLKAENRALRRYVAQLRGRSWTEKTFSRPENQLPF